MEEKSRRLTKMHSDQNMVTTLSPSDYTRLEVLMSTLTGSRDAVADLARRKLASAIVMLPTDIPDTTVSTGRRVRFLVDDAVKERKLVWHAHDTQDDDVVSCLDPLGLALLGLSPSQSVSYRDESGRIRNVIVDDVLIDTPVTLNGVDTAQSRTVDVAVGSRSTLWRHLKVSLSKWLKRRARAALEGLNDNLLADIGMTRRDLDNVADRVIGREFR